jgi:DNA helicase HerA-like ATPase
LSDQPLEVRSFADLEDFFRRIFEFMEVQGRSSEVWRNHHLATIRKVRNRLGNISVRAQGLVTDDGHSSDLPWGEIEDRSLHVIDVAGLDPLTQDLVFARIVSKLREHLERRDLGVDHVIVFVDELNKYAPSDGPDTYVRRMLLDLSERGRYLGLVLFSAQQFRSQVLRRVVGNAGTALYGRMDLDEIASPGYATLSPATRAKLTALPKGELMVRHPHFTQPLFVRFPRPAVMQGRIGVERFPPAPDLPFIQAVARQLRALDRAVSVARVEAVVDGHREDDVRRALHLTRRMRPANVLAFFTAQLGRRVEREVAPTRGITGLRTTADPYA